MIWGGFPPYFWKHPKKFHTQQLLTFIGSLGSPSTASQGTQCVLAIVGNKCDLQSQATVCNGDVTCLCRSWNCECNVTGPCPQSRCWDICQDQSPDGYICFASFNRGTHVDVDNSCRSINARHSVVWSLTVLCSFPRHGCFESLLRLRQSSDMEWRLMGIEMNVSVWILNSKLAGLFVIMSRRRLLVRW